MLDSPYDLSVYQNDPTSQVKCCFWSPCPMVFSVGCPGTCSGNAGGVGGR